MGLFCISPVIVYAGLDRFSYLDEINGWVIERKIDSNLNQVFCRASIPLSGTWFSTRIRLGKDDSLIVPPEMANNEPIRSEVIENVKNRLRICRSSLIYLPANQ